VVLAAVAASPVAPASAGDRTGQGDPRLDYILQCEGCHLAGGEGAPASGVPRMNGFVGRFVGVEGGRAYLVQVPGVAQAPLDDAAIAALLNWMLLRFSPEELPDPFVPYTEAEVARHREQAPIDALKVRATLLAQLEET
jgi:hypothetical protein